MCKVCEIAYLDNIVHLVNSSLLKLNLYWYLHLNVYKKNLSLIMFYAIYGCGFALCFFSGVFNKKDLSWIW